MDSVTQNEPVCTLETLHSLYCSAAAVAENHIGRPDEAQWWTIAERRWQAYEEARDAQQ